MVMHAADAFRVAWYRFARTLRRQWTGYLAIALLLGLVGGLAIGSVAAARRTQGAYLTYLAATNPSDLTVLTGLSGPGGAPGYDPAVIRKIAALPGVRHVASYAGLNVAILGVDGKPVAAPYIGGPLPGSLDGEYFTTDRATAIQGRLPDPARPDEIAIDAKGTPADGARRHRRRARVLHERAAGGAVRGQAGHARPPGSGSRSSARSSTAPRKRRTTSTPSATAARCSPPR